MATYYSSYTLLLVIFKIVVTSKLSTGTRNHAYFSTSEDTQYIGDSLPVSFHKEFSGATGKISIDESLFNSRIHLKFLPPVLDFKERPLGIPHHERVTIINLSCNRTILMSSISGSTVHFHSSFFQDKIIPPLGNTSFSVVFLGRGEGEIKSYLYIHTSEGSFKYQVRGESVSSPYRLRSLSGVKLPLNASYTPAIFIHNPHSITLQILEVYSSGNAFHLELPSGELGGPKHIWQIPPFSTKPIIRLRFHASPQKNHSAYVRIKLDKGNQILMMPIDVEVGSVCGLYASDDLINFGVGGTQDPPKLVKLFLKNSSRKSIKVSSIVTSPRSKALKIDFQPIVVPPKSKNPTEVALLTFDWDAAHKSGFTSGKIIIKSNQYNQKLILQYYASVFVGGIEYNIDQIKFKSDEAKILPRIITLQNNFNVPVVITNVSLCELVKSYFKVKNFSSTIISPGETKSIFSLEVKRNFYNSQLRMESAIRITSNASSLDIPLICYDGKLKKIVTWDTNDTYLHIGSVSIGNTKKFYFGLINENPIGVFIKSLNVNISNAVVGIVAVDHGNITNAMNAITSEYDIDRTGELHLDSGNYCVIEVSIPGNDLGYTYGQIVINTEYETMKIGIKLKVDQGKELKVAANPVKHESCTPHEVCRTELVVESHFTVSVYGSNLSAPHHSSLGFVSSFHVLPFSNMFLQNFTWNMNETVSCFPLITNSSGTYKWLNSVQGPFFSHQWNINLLIMHYENYLKLSAELMKLTLWLNASEIRNISFKGLMKPEWPAVTTIEPQIMELPTSPVSNISSNDIIITNPLPRQHPVTQLVLEPSYPLAESINDFPTSSNMTTPETGKLIGSGTYGQFKFGSRKPGISLPLLFELSEKHLRGCERNGEGKGSRLTLTARRSFLAKNTGGIPVNVIGFMISGYPCEGFGFRVINCQPFLLPINASKKIDIAFTPDFTLSKVNRILTVLTPDASVNYTLTATLPPYFLSQCSNAIRRPTWEPLVYYCAVSFLLFLLICVLGAAFFESNRILRNTIITLSRDNNIQPVLDLRVIGSEAVTSPEQKPLHNETQCKIMWPTNNFNEEQASKENQKPAADGILTLNCSSKCQILNNSINCKKKSDRAVCKRYADGTENYIEKTCWDTPFTRNNSSQIAKPLKTPICITTEPYIPLTNIKTRDSSELKPEFSNSKFEQPRFIEFQRKKAKKKSQNPNVTAEISNKKKPPVDVPLTRNIFEESGSSRTTSESSCSDDGEKDVESMFFQSVRHHLQSKVTRGRHIKLSNSSPLLKRKKSVEKSVVNVSNTEWDLDEDDTSEKATVVRNNRRSMASVKQLKKQTVNYGKARFEQSQSRGKPSIGERAMKCCLRKEKTQIAKKRNERMEKRVTSTKVTTLGVTHDGAVPPLPTPPVWTTSFSDVVAGTDSSYSNANKNNSTSSQNQKQQLGICSIDPGNTCTSKSLSNYSAGWKNEYQDALEQQDNASGQVPVEMKHPLNNVWGNWSSLAESLQTQANVLQTSSANSLFTDGSSQASTYDPIWNDQNLLKAIQGHQEMENSHSFHTVRNDISWPIITSLWEPLYTPSSAVESPPPVWGSDVWGPPVSPPPPNPPTPAEEVVQSNMEYDPFRSLSNIWGQHSPNIWKPPTTE